MRRSIYPALLDQSSFPGQTAPRTPPTWTVDEYPQETHHESMSDQDVGHADGVQKRSRTQATNSRTRKAPPYRRQARCGATPRKTPSTRKQVPASTVAVPSGRPSSRRIEDEWDIYLEYEGEDIGRQESKRHICRLRNYNIKRDIESRWK